MIYTFTIDTIKPSVVMEGGESGACTNNDVSLILEEEGLVDKVKEILKMENADDRTESLGETLFYFLLKFIPQYKLNITEGKCTDTTLCSKLTGILIRTDVNNLLEIISNTYRLYNSLKDVLVKLMKTNRLDN